MQSIITKEYDYALRILLFLINKKEYTSLEAIHKKMHIKKSMIIKIIQKLKKTSLVTTKTGQKGGIIMDKCITNMSIYEVLSNMGINISFNDCINSKSCCTLETICKATKFFSELTNDVNIKLKEKKMKELVFDNI